MNVMGVNVKRDRSPTSSDGPRRQRRVGSRFNSPRRLDPTIKRVLVTNMPYQFRWQELKDLFRDNVGVVTFTEVFTDENGKSRGSGVVEFESTESVAKALKVMHQFDVNGRKLIVKVDDGITELPKSNIPMKLEQSVDEWGRQDLQDIVAHDQDTSIVWGETYGLSQNFLAGLDIRGPLLTRIFIANLDFKVTRKKLKEVFKLAGKIVDIDLKMTADGVSRGFATIDYDHPVEAVQAISMFTNQYLFQRKMTVRMDRSDRNSEQVRLPEGLSGMGMGLGTNGQPLLDVARNLHSLVGEAPTVNLPPAPSHGSAVNTQFGLLSSVGDGLMGLPMRSNDGLFPIPPAMPSAVPSAMPYASQYNGNQPMLGLGNLDPKDYRLPIPSDRNMPPPSNSRVEPPRYDGPDRSRYYSRNEPDRYNVGSNNNISDSRYSNRDRGSNHNNGAMGMNRPVNQEMKSDIILIKNLPLGMDKDKLREWYSEFGRVSYCEMHSAEVGLVRYFNDADAEQALLRTDGLIYRDRRLVVSYYS